MSGATQIIGYRALSGDQIDLINAIKEQGNNLGLAVEAVGAIPEVDKHALTLAKAHLQTGLMWLTRAVARPEGF